MKLVEPDVEAAAEIVVRKMQRSRAPGDIRDMRQVALLAALEARSRFDPRKGNLRSYLTSAAIRQVGNQISRDLSVVSIGRAWSSARDFAGRVDPGDAHLEAGDDPESALSGAEEASARARWRLRLRRAIERTLDSLDDVERQAVERTFGLGGQAQIRVDEAAREMGVERAFVQRARARFKKAVAADDEMFRLAVEDR
jgi:RNA polymerase sigma factor (sigma-70 family)